MEYKTEKVDGFEVVYSADWINDLESEQHFVWYYHQAKQVYDLCTRDDRILEIGVGTSLLSDMLRRRGWNIKTLDIDSEKHPDFCSSAIDFDYTQLDISVILAFEIFEHIPYSTFQQVLHQLARSGIETIIFSLPWNEYRLVDFSLSMPKLGDLRFRIPLRKNKITTRAHFWELAKRSKMLDQGQLVSLSKLRRLFEDEGYAISALERVGIIQYFAASSESRQGNAQ